MNCFLFKGLNDIQLKKVEQKAEVVFWENGQDLYRKGSIGIMLTGTAKILKCGKSGDKQSMRNINEGEMFGAASLFGEWNDGASKIEATEKCSCMYISEKLLVEIFAQYPPVAVNYIQFLTDRLRFLNAKVDTFSAKNADKTIMEYLLSSADEFGLVEKEITMSELAKRLGIGRSSLYRSVESLQKEGKISVDKNRFKILGGNTK